MTDSHDRQHAVLRAAWIAVAVIAAIGALGAGLAYVTASPAVCAACHDMRPKVETWRTSAHNQVGCPACHEDPRRWYEFPQTLAVRSVMLGRDVKAHLAGAEATAAVPYDAASAIPDYRCDACHDPSREVTMRYGTLIDHKEHAKRNRSCVSCHLWTAHPDPEVERPLLMMEMCFGCHGRAADADAPGTCDVCHPPTFEERPESHAPSDWKDVHGKDANKVGQPQCLMCHDDTYCLDCHGVEMPHPAGWEAGATGHGPIAIEGRDVCARCHEQGLDFCSMCHHEGYDPTKGPWAKQHPDTADERGTAFCLTECHAPTYCVYCHTTGRIPPEPDPGTPRPEDR